MRRRRQEFTREIAGAELIAARRQGIQWGMTHAVNELSISSCPFTGWNSWSRALSNAWHDGLREGRAERRRELKALCADELAADDATAPRIVFDPGYMDGSAP